MLVVDSSSTGCEIFCCLMVSECLVVKLLLGMGGTPLSMLGLAVRRVVKARDSEVDMMGEDEENEWWRNW